MERREFLKTAGNVTAGFCLGCIAGCGNLNGTKSVEIKEPLDISLADYPQLSKVGGSALIKIPGYPPILLFVPQEDQMMALSAKCTHWGNLVQYQHEERKIYCGAHHSEFDLIGNVLKGPAAKPLTRYSVERSPDTIRIKSAS